MMLDQPTFARATVQNVLTVAGVGAALVLVLEPSHTESLPIFTAYALWFSHIAMIALLFFTGDAVLEFLGLPKPLPSVLAALVLPVPFAILSLGLDFGFGNAMGELATEGFTVAVISDEILAVTPISYAVALTIVFLRRWGRPDKAVQEDVPASQGTQTALRHLIPSVPQALGDDIIHLQALDHYVEIVTTKGNAMLTEQFGECLEKLAGLDGIQCHRSHWVSLAHIDQISRKGSAYVCRLSNGDDVPVSRRRYAELRDRIGQG